MSNSVILLLRVVHIAFGAIWFGGTLNAALFLFPAANPAVLSKDFGTRLVARARLLTFTTAAGAIAMIAGFALYWGIWAGFGFVDPARWYAMGGHFAIVAMLLTLIIGLPTSHKLRGLGHTIAAQDEPPTIEQNKLGIRLTGRLKWATRLSAVLLLMTVSLMAIGRYV